MALTMYVLMLNTDRIKNRIPAQNTAPSAVAQGTFIPKTAVNVKKAFNPIPGATIIGLFAYRPIIRLLKNDTNTVAVSTPANGNPAWLSTEGLTTIMYEVAKKEEAPASTSVCQVVLFCFSAK